MMLQINNTGQVYTPRNTGCTSIIGGSLSLRAERFVRDTLAFDTNLTTAGRLGRTGTA
jgi:hypothetical protein